MVHSRAALGWLLFPGTAIAALGRPPLRDASALPQPSPWRDAPALGSLSRRNILAIGGAAASLALAPRPAQASFGSARGAVTSPPVLGSIELEKLQDLTPKKRKQIESVLTPRQAEALRLQIEAERAGLLQQYEQEKRRGQQRVEAQRVVKQQIDATSADIVTLEQRIRDLEEQQTSLGGTRARVELPEAPARNLTSLSARSRINLERPGAGAKPVEQTAGEALAEQFEAPAQQPLWPHLSRTHTSLDPQVDGQFARGRRGPFPDPRPRLPQAQLAQLKRSVDDRQRKARETGHGRPPTAPPDFSRGGLP